MEPVNNAQTAPFADFEWYGGPPYEAAPDKEIPDEPPLGELSEDDWAWLLSYKYDEWLELNAHFRPPLGLRQGTTPKEVALFAERRRTFEFVKSLEDQGIALENWGKPMPHAVAQYVYFSKRLTEAQKEYLQGVASGEITPSFPDPSDEAEEHRGQPKQWS